MLSFVDTLIVYSGIFLTKKTTQNISPLMLQTENYPLLQRMLFPHRKHDKLKSFSMLKPKNSKINRRGGPPENNTNALEECYNWNLSFEVFYGFPGISISDTL